MSIQTLNGYKIGAKGAIRSSNTVGYIKAACAHGNLVLVCSSSAHGAPGVQGATGPIRGMAFTQRQPERPAPGVSVRVVNRRSRFPGAGAGSKPQTRHSASRRRALAGMKRWCRFEGWTGDTVLLARKRQPREGARESAASPCLSHRRRLSKRPDDSQGQLARSGNLKPNDTFWRC